MCLRQLNTAAERCLHAAAAQRLVSTEGQDVFEEVLELVAYFTYFSPTVRSPALSVCKPRVQGLPRAAGLHLLMARWAPGRH